MTFPRCSVVATPLCRRFEARQHSPAQYGDRAPSLQPRRAGSLSHNRHTKQFVGPTATAPSFPSRMETLAELPPRFAQTHRASQARVARDRSIRLFFQSNALVAIVVLALITIFLFREGVGFLWAEPEQHPALSAKRAGIRRYHAPICRGAHRALARLERACASANSAPRKPPACRSSRSMPTSRLSINSPPPLAIPRSH